MDSSKPLYKCKLCGMMFEYSNMSEEHYPARNTGNYDIVELDLCKLIDAFQSAELHSEIIHRANNGENIEDIAG